MADEEAAAAEREAAAAAEGASGKRKADVAEDDEDTPTAKRAEREAAAAAAAAFAAADDPPGDAEAAARPEAASAADPPAEDAPPSAPDDGGDAAAAAAAAAPQETALPAAHDPAYAAAAFAEPPVVAAVGVGYTMPPYLGDTNAYSFLIDPVLVGRIIGKGGETIRQLQAASGAHIDIDQNFPAGQPRKVTLTGPAASITACRSLLDDLLRTPAGPAPGTIVVPPGGTERLVQCSRQMIGRVIGRAGDVIKGLQAISGARIQIDQSTDPCRVSITGTQEAVDAAAAMVSDIAQGGSTVQYGYQAYAARTAAGAGAWGAAAMQQQPGAGVPYGGAHYYPQAYAQQYGGAYGAAAYAGYGYPYGYADPAAAAAYAYAGQAQAGAEMQQQQQQQQAQAQQAQQQAAQPGASPHAAAAASPAAGGAAAGPPAPGGASPSPWTAVDDGQGHTYYFNSLTGVSQWDKPPGM